MDWGEITTIIAVITAFTALITTIYNVKGIRIQHKTTQLTGILSIHKEIQLAENRLQSAIKDAKIDRAAAEREAVNLLNLLEILASLLNKKSLESATADYTREYLIESIAHIEIDHIWMEMVENAITNKTTFRNIQEYRKNHRAEIEKLKKIYSQKN